MEANAQVVVLVDRKEGKSEPAVEQLLAQARSTGARASILSAEELTLLTEKKEIAEPPGTVVLGPSVFEPLKTARRLRASGLDSYIVFAADRDQMPKMRKELFYSGPPGAQWALEPVDSPKLAEVIERGSSAVERNKQFRSTLDRINSRIGQAPTTDATRYRQLLVSDRYLTSILKYAQDAIISLDRTGHVATWNRGAEQLFEIPAPAALNVPVASLLSDSTDIEKIIGKAASGEVIRTVLPYSCAHEMKFLDAVFTPIEDETEGVIGLTLIIRDITEQRRSAEALKDADRRKDEFLAVLAHELRNPLAPVRNALELLKMPGIGEAEREWSRDIAERQVCHMARLLDDLLDVSRISRGSLKLQKEIVPLRQVIEEAIDTARSLIDEKGHELLIELPAKEIRLEADPLRMTQIFGNLLSNAAKYTQAQGEIRISARLEHDFVAVSVKDNGFGIKEEMLARIFEMFTQLPIESAESGIGVGLAITRGLVELHGGHIEAHSKGLGCGSEFIVRLPACRVSQAVNDGTAQDSREKATFARRVLVVDDNVDSAESLAMLLKHAGHAARTAFHGAAALKAVEEHSPEVVLLDIGMPQMDGYEVARRLRAMPQGKDALLVAVTGWGQEEDRRRSAEAGFDEHVTKPVDPMLLAELISGGK